MTKKENGRAARKLKSAGKEKNNMLDMPRVSDVSEERIDRFEPGEVVPRHNFEEIVGTSAAFESCAEPS
jgi:hypothetical protein